jgi:DNA-binding MarR family transcriptional regulator
MSRLNQAAEIADHLQAIRRTLREAVWEQARRYPVPLTGPQLHVLQALVAEARATGAGLSVSDLSGRVGLAHSTVSGIVARLEDRRLLRRVTDPDDRRRTRVELTPRVRSWVDRELPAARQQPIAAALGRASPAERAEVTRGVATLRRLLDELG